MLRQYVFGAPLTWSGLERFGSEILAKYRKHFQTIAAAELGDHAGDPERQRHIHEAVEARALESSTTYLEAILQRVTDKSSGLLQALAFLGAFVALLEPSNKLLQPSGDLGLFLGFMFIVAVCCLIANLQIVWYRDATTYGDYQRDFERVLHLIQARSLRLASAIWLSFLGAAILIGYAILRKWNDLPNALLGVITHFIASTLALAERLLGS